MDSRTATKVFLKLLFELVEEKGDEYRFNREQVEKAVEMMHDDDTFFDQLVDFFAEHIDDFGENYELF